MGEENPQDKFKKACESSLRFLCEGILQMTKWDDLHDDMEQWLKDTGPEKLILVPRGHLKSSIVTVGYTIQEILKNPDIRILLTHATWNGARKFLRQISEYFTFNSILPKIYGDFKVPERTWTRDEITVGQRTSTITREATVTCAGVETALAGSHFDLIIHDDLVEESNIGTKEQIEKVINFYRNSRPLLDPGGRIILVGTRWAEDDLYGMVIKELSGTINRQPVFTQAERLKWREYVES